MRGFSGFGLLLSSDTHQQQTHTECHTSDILLDCLRAQLLHVHHSGHERDVHDPLGWPGPGCCEGLESPA